MEGLFLLIAEFIGVLLLAPLLSALAAVAEILGLVVGGVLELLVVRARRRRPATDLAPDPAPRAPWLPRLRRGLWWALGAGLVLVVLMQTLLFTPLVRWAAARQDAITVEFKAAHGNLFTGRVVLEDLTLRRDDLGRGSFDLRVDRLELDLALLRAWSSPRTLQALLVTGVRGSYERDLVLKPPRRPVLVERLELAQVKVDVVLRRGEREQRFPLTIASWHSAPWRSQLAVVDALLRTNATGTVAERPFRISTQELADAGGQGRQTRCEVAELPLLMLGTWLGGPLAVLAGGTADIVVQDRWLLGSEDRIDSEWQVVLRDVRAEVPAGLEGLSAKLALPLARWLQGRTQETRLMFRVRLAEGELSADSSALARALATGFLGALAEAAGVDRKLLDAAAGGLELFRGFVRRRR